MRLPSKAIGLLPPTCLPAPPCTDQRALCRHKAIVAYLSSNNLPTAAEALRQELNIADTFDAATSKKYEGLLEKKWTSVVRLQKKVCLHLPTLAACAIALTS